MFSCDTLRSMKRFNTAIIYTIVGLLLLGTAILSFVYLTRYTEAPVQSQNVVSTQDTVEKPTATEMLRLVNIEREKAGVAPLVIDERLNASAQQKAEDMFTHNYNGHVDPSGRHGYDIAHEKAPDICMNPSENLYWGNSSLYPSSSAGAVEGWKTSPLHFKAMTNTKYTYTGFGIAGTKIVQHFC